MTAIDMAAVWAKLAAPLPDSAIHQRQGAGGRMLDYIDRPVVWERLDSVVPGQWEFTVEILGQSGNAEAAEAYAAKGRLTIYGVIREDIGQGKDLKDASTDAFKRCAVQFGIGRQLYVKGTVGVSTQQRRTPASSGADRTVSVPASTTPSPASQPDEEGVSCPKCGAADMWDNRLSKRNPKAPDFKCRSRSCDGVIWPEKPRAATSEPLWDDAPPYDDADPVPF